MQHTANTLLGVSVIKTCNKPTRCNKLHHAATHCNTPQHTDSITYSAQPWWKYTTNQHAACSPRAQPHQYLCVAVCCSVLRCVAVCCSVLQCVAECCSVLQRVAVCCSMLQCRSICMLATCPASPVSMCCSVSRCVAVCCDMLQHVAACCCVLRSVSVYCDALQCVAMCCRVLQYVAVSCHHHHHHAGYLPSLTSISVLQIVAMCCILLQLVVVCCSLLQLVAACCNVLQCVAVCCNVLQSHDGTHMNESWHTHEWVMPHTWMGHVSLWMSHITRMNESCHPSPETNQSCCNTLQHAATHCSTR